MLFRSQLYQLGKRIASGEVRDPSFYMAWWEPSKDESPFADSNAMEEANPSLGVILDKEDLVRSLPPITPENEFRTKRLNQWTQAAKSWLPHGAWDRCAATAEFEPDEPIIVSFDGSWTNDSTAMVACSIRNRHIKVLNAWERPIDAQSWVVPSAEVEAAIFEAAGTYNVVEFACDPYYWREQLARWGDAGLPIVEWPSNSLNRIVPACREFYKAVVEQTLSHDGDARLARHLTNATVKEDQYGTRIVKKAQGQKIDLAIAAIIAFDRANAWRPSDDVPEFIPIEG